MSDKSLFDVAASWFDDNAYPQDVFSESALKEWARYEGIEKLFTKKEIIETAVDTLAGGRPEELFTDEQLVSWAYRNGFIDAPSEDGVRRRVW